MESESSLPITENRGAHVERVLEIAVIVAALLTIPLIVAQEREAGGWLVVLGDWTVWSVFTIEYALMSSIARDRWEYTRRNWLNVAVIVLSFPALPALFALTRLVRLVRVVRLLRVARLTVVGARGLKALGSVFGRRGLLYMVIITIVVVLFGGAIIVVLEPESVDGIGSGIWWAAVTAATVGYGDIAPASVAGRVVAIIIMIAGIGLFAALAAAVAAHFVGQSEGAEIEEMRSQLNRIEQSLEEMKRRGISQ